MEYNERRRVIGSRLRSIGVYLRKQQSELYEIEIEDKGTHQGKGDIVTRVDRESERRVVEMLGSEFPDDGIRAEEGTRVPSSSGRTWVVDPIDGTVNFVHGHPFYSISVGAVVEGEIREGYVYVPQLDTLYEGRTDGASRRDGHELTVSPIEDPEQSLLTTGAWEHDPGPREFHRASMDRILPSIQGLLQNGSAALDLCLVAEGSLEGFWQLNISPWDYVAGVAILRGAGGRVTDFSGDPTGPDDSRLIASNGPMHEWIRSRLKESLPRNAG